MSRKRLFLFTALLAVLTAGTVQAAPPAKPEGTLEILGAEFGIFEEGKPGEVIFEPTDVVPRKLGQRYGWMIEVRTSKRSLAVREEYLLPTPAKAPKADDPLSESLSIPAQRRSQVSQRQLVPVDGRIYGEWSVGPDEPPGHRRLQVMVEGQLGASFEYDMK